MADLRQSMKKTKYATNHFIQYNISINIYSGTYVNCNIQIS